MVKSKLLPRSGSVGLRQLNAIHKKGHKVLKVFFSSKSNCKISLKIYMQIINGKWVKVFKNGPSKICGRQPLKNLKLYGLPKHFPFDLDTELKER